MTESEIELRAMAIRSARYALEGCRMGMMGALPKDRAYWLSLIAEQEARIERLSQPVGQLTFAFDTP